MEHPLTQPEEQSLTKQQQFEKLLTAYGCYFDVNRDLAVGDFVFPAMAEFHSRSEKYVLVKSAKIWGMEQNEYVYLVLADTLEEPFLSHVIALAQQDGMGRIKPHGEHMYSYVSMAVIADHVTPEAERLIRRYRFGKSFRLALHGWMEFRIAALDRSSGKVLSNRAGRDVRETLEQNLAKK